MTLGKSKPKYGQSLTMWILLVLNNFIKKRFTGKSKDLRSVLVSGQTSRPYIRTGIHLLLISWIITSSDAKFNHFMLTINDKTMRLGKLTGMRMPKMQDWKMKDLRTTQFYAGTTTGSGEMLSCPDGFLSGSVVHFYSPPLTPSTYTNNIHSTTAEFIIYTVYHHKHGI